MRTKGAKMAGKDGDKPLRRIIQMLLALSLLAERASGAPWPVRCLVLWLLRRSEAAASGFVGEVLQTPLGIIDPADLPDDNSPGGALRLAMRLRALAAALGCALDDLPPMALNGPAGRRLSLSSVYQALRHFHGPALGSPRPPDTS